MEPLRRLDELSSAFSRRSGVTEIAVEEFFQVQLAVAAGHARLLLLDVRTQAEQSVSTLPESIRVPPNASPAQVEQLKDFPGRSGSPNLPTWIVAYCAAGYRSARFLARGGENFCRPPCYNLRGGIIAYAGAGGRLLGPTGEDTNRVHGYNAEWAGFVQAPVRAVIEPPPETARPGRRA